MSKTSFKKPIVLFEKPKSQNFIRKAESFIQNSESENFIYHLFF